MTKVSSFPAIASPSANTLILSSMPGVASLSAHQYYAHPRNAFWPIMQHVFKIDASASYEARIDAIKHANIAIWDVLQQCERPGSLDSAIKSGSRVPNDFSLFFKQHVHIKRVLLNGGEAEKSFKRYVSGQLDLSGMRVIRLPSTSPAHTLAFEEKLRLWHEALLSE